MQREGPSLRHALGVLRHRDFALFYSALLVATVGSQIQNFANVLLIYDLTHSPLQIGLTGLARAVPLIGLSLVGGVIADRLDRKRLIMIAQGTNAALSLVLAGLSAAGVIEVWHIYAVTVVGSSLMAVSGPARSAMIPNLVPREHLMQALALNSVTWQFANIIGPTLAGIILVAAGFPATYLANSTALVVTLACLTLVQAPPVRATRRQTALRSVGEGLAFVHQRSIILALLAMDAAAMLFGTFPVVLPVIGERLGLDPAGTGLLFAAPGVGSLVGAALIMSLRDIRYKGYLIVGAILAYCACLALL